MRQSSLFSFYNIIVVISILGQVINALSDEKLLTVSISSFITKDDDFDTTTLYKISNSSIKEKTGGGFKDKNFNLIYDGFYSIETHSRTKTTGYPSEIITPSNISNNPLFQNGSFIKLSTIDKYWRKNYTTIFGLYCNSDRSNQNNFPDKNVLDCLEVFDYGCTHGVHHSTKKPIPILTIEWQQQNNLNSLRIIYIFKKNMYFDVEIIIRGENNEKLYESDLQTTSEISQFIIKSKEFHNNVKYKIIFNKKYTVDHPKTKDVTPFAIYKIANYFQTSDSDYNSQNQSDISGNDSEITSGVFSRIIQPSPFNVFEKSNDITNNIITISSASNCLNGGYRLKDRCLCPPGFQGELCEKGCGPNSFGADCSGLCSMFTRQGCRGIYFCSSNYGCACSAGLTGRFCDEDCSPGTYGANCNQNCSSNCIDKTCDQYTGLCTHGCQKGYKLPKCIEKYAASLRDPPKFIAADHDAITVEINFGSENIIDKNENTQIKYYQLIWKNNNEKINHYSKIKQISSNKSIETINDLKSDTTYNISVIIIMDDGNFIENTVFGQYKTTCKQNPHINENDIQVIEGLTSITITWDKVSFGRLECPIKELSLTLNMIYNKNNKHEQKNFTTTVKNTQNLKNIYTIEDLVPGYEYNVYATLITSIGPLTPSQTYKFTPKFTSDDIIIKNIMTKYMDQNKKICISWELGDNYFGQNDVIDNNTSSTFIVKYKINRTFSCPLEEKKSNWTSVIVKNSSEFNITDVIPNSQYIIQVIVGSEDKNTDQRENVVYLLTPASMPTLKPVLEQPPNVTNNSVSIKWKIDDSDCSKINGIFKGFIIEIKNTKNNTITTEKTEKYEKHFDDINSMIDYELKIFIENNIGHSPEHFLQIKFKYENISIAKLSAEYKEHNKQIFISWTPEVEAFGVNDVIVIKPSTYTVKYKIIRLNNCSVEEKENNWTPVIVKNGTYYNISEVTPNSQYMIQVFVGSENIITDQTGNLVNVSIPASVPTLKPILEQPQNVTNNSVSIKLKIDDSDCSKMNGIFKGFFLELKNLEENSIAIKETEKYEIVFEDLKPMNDYELKIFIKNDVGHSLEHFLQVKFKNVISVSDLVIYKWNLKQNEVGLRWKYSNPNSTIQEFIFLIDNGTSNNKMYSFNPNPCAAWPEYYCQTISHLNLNCNFSIKVKAKYSDGRETGETSVTFFNKVANNVPNPPRNLKIIEILKNNITLQWDIPWIINVEFMYFIIYVNDVSSEKDGSTSEISNKIEFKDEQPTYNYTLQNLKPNSTYNIQVKSLSTGMKYSSPIVTNVTTSS